MDKLGDMFFSGIELRTGMVPSESSKTTNEESKQSTAAKFRAGKFRVS